MSNMAMATDILIRAQKPFISRDHYSGKGKYGITLDRESCQCLGQEVHRRQGLSRSAPNTFEIEAE